MRPPLHALLVAAALSSLVACAPAVQQASPAAQPAAAPSSTAPGSAQRDEWLAMFARGYYPGRSGQVFMVPREGDFVTSRDDLYAFMHGSPYGYDTRIPILFHGAPFVTAGTYARATQQDIAPTIGALIGAPWLATYTGRVLTDAVAGGAARPRVVSLFVLDAMRQDYFDKHAAVMPTLTRLRKEGAWFADARSVVLPTVTGVGHANIGTGSEPRIHGIVVNTLFNRTTGKRQEAYDQLDTRELQALTVADAWNIATDGKAVIIGQGGAIRATAGLVGHGACAISGRKVIAASYGGPEGGFETNPTCYTKARALEQFTARKVWEAAGGTWMGYDIATASKFRASSLFQKYEMEALRAVVEESAVGADDITDLVFVNIKGPDYAAHAHGPESKELVATLRELDTQVAAYLAEVDKKAGPGRNVVVISADHGMPGVPSAPRRRYYLDEIIAAFNKKFDPTGAAIQYYDDAANNQMHLDTARLQSLGYSLKDVATFLESEFFAAAFTEDDVRAAQARLPR